MISVLNVGNHHPCLLHFPSNPETPTLLSPVPSPECFSLKLNIALRAGFGGNARANSRGSQGEWRFKGEVLFKYMGAGHVLNALTQNPADPIRC